MREIAIIGAGELGGAVAHLLARRNAAAVIRLVDERGRAAEGKALDIMQAAPIEQFASSVSGTSDVTAVSGAGIVIVADRFGGADWNGEAGLMLLKRLAEFARAAMVVCAAGSQRDLVDRGVRELHLDRRRLIGSAPEALAGGVRALVALVLNRSPKDVSVAVLGDPPAHIIVPWDDASIGGERLTALLDDRTRRRLEARLAAMWPPGPYALAAAAGRAVDALLGQSRTVMSSYVVPDSGSGERVRTAALPVRLGPSGVEAIPMPRLSVADQVALETAMLL